MKGLGLPRTWVFAVVVFWIGATAHAEPAATHPDVIHATIEETGANRFDVSATMSSPYDSPERYADAFRVTTDDGRVLGVRELFHDHSAEQPFTRGLYGIMIPDDVDRVRIEGRDSRNGWGGEVQWVAVPGRS